MPKNKSYKLNTTIMPNNNEKRDYNTGFSGGTKKFWKFLLMVVLWSRRSKKCLIKNLKKVPYQGSKKCLKKKKITKLTKKIPEIEPFLKHVSKVCKITRVI